MHWVTRKLRGPELPAVGQNLDVRRGRLAHYLINFAVSSLWLFYAWRSFNLWHDTYATLQLMLLLRNTSLTALFLCRRPAKVTSRSVKEWVIAMVGTCIGYFYGSGAVLLPGVATVLIIVAGCMCTVSILALGRSFGIVPANRGIIAGGPYAVVRHPIYLSYVVFDVGYLLGALSLHNVLVFVGLILSFYLRATYEERLLHQDPGYCEYAKRTPYMFIPGLL